VLVVLSLLASPLLHYVKIYQVGNLEIPEKTEIENGHLPELLQQYDKAWKDPICMVNKSEKLSFLVKINL